MQRREVKGTVRGGDATFPCSRVIAAASATAKCADFYVFASVSDADASQCEVKCRHADVLPPRHRHGLLTPAAPRQRAI